jgi:Family of unknown function (DUF5759)
VSRKQCLSTLKIRIPDFGVDSEMSYNMTEKTPILRPEDLYSQRKTRDSSRLKTYNQILEQIHHRIQTVSRLPTGSVTQILYAIPDFIFGLPRIDLEDCVVYLVYQLRTSGFEVKYTYPNLLNISWSHTERSYILEQSPIMQAMVDSKESADRAARVSDKKFKKVSKVIMAGAGGSGGVGAVGGNDILDLGGAGGGAGGPGGPTPKKGRREPKKTLQESYPSLAAIKTVLSAKDYVPPTSFMENMERPSPPPSGGSGGGGGGGGNGIASDSGRKSQIMMW